MEDFLTVASDARKKYQNYLVATAQLSDHDYNRSLTHEEISLLHNAWMNDAQSWMHPNSFQNYERLRNEARLRVDGKGNGKRGAAKPAKGQGKSQRNPGREAHELKKSGFNTFCFQFIGNKALLMCAVQHPAVFTTAEGLQGILNELEEAHESAEYKRLLANAKRRTEEESLLKQKRETAVKNLMRGRADVKNGKDTQLAREFRDGIGLGSIAVFHNLSMREEGRGSMAV